MSPRAVAAVRERLRAALGDGRPESRLEADLLLTAVLDRPRTWLIAHDRDLLDEPSIARAEALVGRRRRGEPIAYLLGRREFWSLDLAVSPAVLIPRPETECLVEAALARLPPDADLRAWLVASDTSAAALGVAAGNASRLVPGRIALVRGAWLAPYADHALDRVVSNPPYVAAGDPYLTRGDLRFEPPEALSPGGDGLDAIRAIVAEAPRCLRPGGWLALEHGADQGPPVRELLAAAGFESIATRQDLAGLDRVTAGRRPPADRAPR